MQLSERMKAVAALVSPGSRVVDVGCDHGYLPIYLVMNKRIPSAVAMDVKSGPLSRAQENIKAHGLDTYIETRLSDGLKNLKKGEGDTLIIAGMGGPLMEKILEEGKEQLTDFRELILQPQSDLGNFRRYLVREGFRIIRENMVYEEGKYYPMMKAVPGESEAYQPWEYEYGKLLLKEKHPVLKEYLKRETRLQKQILQQIQAKGSAFSREREAQIRQNQYLTEEAFKAYEM